MKKIGSVSRVKSRKQAAKLLREVANAVETDRDTCVAGHFGTKGNFTYDIFKGDPDIISAYKYIVI